MHLAARPIRLAAALAACAVLSALALTPAPADAAVTCTRVAAETGSDTAAGSADAPYRTVRKLLASLQSGQTGCVRGTIRESDWITTSGVTLTSEPGQTGALLGQLVVDKDAAHVTVSDLRVDSTGLTVPSIIILGDDARFARNDVTNGQGPTICFILGQLGHDDNALAERATIEANRIHDCGTSDNHRHGIYVEHADGTHIVGNEIFDNADRGIQLYPSAQNTLIEGNVIDGNGEGVIFSGAGTSTSSGNVVRYNLLTNPRLRAVVESYYPSGTPKGTGNVVEQNCIAGSARTLVDTGAGGFTAGDNLFTDPGYADRAAKNFAIADDSPCGRLLAAGRAGVEIPTVTLPAPPAPVAVVAPTAPAPVAATAPKPAPSTTPTTATRGRAPVTAAPTVTAAPVRPAAEADASPARPAGSQRRVLQELPAVRIVVRRPSARKARVTLRLADGTTTAARVLVEVRWRGRTWRTVATPKLEGTRARTLNLRLPRGARGVQIRATAVEPAETGL